MKKYNDLINGEKAIIVTSPLIKEMGQKNDLSLKQTIQLLYVINPEVEMHHGIYILSIKGMSQIENAFSDALESLITCYESEIK